MKRIYLITLPERVWHWTNAVLFISLAVSGVLMHASQLLENVSLGALIRVHNLSVVLFIANLAFWLVYQAASGRILHYFRLERDFPARLLGQARFYLLDIFKGGPHPYPVSAESKFNPLQRVTYLGLMFGLLPLQVLTGTVLYGFTMRVEWLTNLPWFRAIALTHTALSYLLIAFLIGHIYLATTGETPLDLLRSMISGWHESSNGEESLDGND